MGYNTDFRGQLLFKVKPNEKAVKVMDELFGNDLREFPEIKSKGMTWVNLDRFEDGIEWNDDEKSYDMVEKVNLIIHECKKVHPEFSLTGEMQAKGEEWDDVWLLRMTKGEAKRIEMSITED